MPANFQPHDFTPLPLLGNAHLQTILANFLPGDPLVASARLRLVRLPDNDRLVLHDSVPRGWFPGEPIALLVHGLTGSHRSGYMQRIGADFLRRGVRAVRLDLRGAGKGVALARKCYHAGCSADVRAVLEAIHESSPKSPITLIGFSLGGNIALKLAGEAAEQPVPGLRAVAAVGPPIDLSRCQRLLAQPRNRIYEVHFVRQLIRSVHRRARHFPDEPQRRFPRPEAMTLPDFDDRYTAPLWGFADAWDYYRRSSALPYVPRIRVPTLLLTARDDPFIAVEPFEEVAGLTNVETRIVPYGGHLGFIGWDGAGGIRWAERRVVDWVMQL
jgi:uncharacterized protein